MSLFDCMAWLQGLYLEAQVQKLMQYQSAGTSWPRGWTEGWPRQGQLPRQERHPQWRARTGQAWPLSRACQLMLQACTLILRQCVRGGADSSHWYICVGNYYSYRAASCGLYLACRCGCNAYKVLAGIELAESVLSRRHVHECEEATASLCILTAVAECEAQDLAACRLWAAWRQIWSIWPTTHWTCAAVRSPPDRKGDAFHSCDGLLAR